AERESQRVQVGDGRTVDGVSDGGTVKRGVRASSGSEQLCGLPPFRAQRGGDEIVADFGECAQVVVDEVFPAQRDAVTEGAHRDLDFAVVEYALLVLAAQGASVERSPQAPEPDALTGPAAAVCPDPPVVGVRGGWRVLCGSPQRVRRGVAMR